MLKALPVLATLRTPLQITQTPAAPAPAALDLSGLIDLVGDGQADLRAVLADFHTSTVALHNKLVAALADGSREKLVLSAHALKGAAGYAGARAIGEHAEMLESRAKDGAALETLHDPVAALGKVLMRLPEEIDASLAAHFG